MTGKTLAKSAGAKMQPDAKCHADTGKSVASTPTNSITSAETARIIRLFGLGLLLRMVLLLAFHFTGVEQTLVLSKDAALYDQMGKQIAEYYRTGGATAWPAHVTGTLDHLYEHVVGVTYYLTGNSILAIRLINAICGSLVILTTWRMARYLTDARTAFYASLGACFLPTLVYYSCLPILDAQSTCAMSLVFLGMTAMTSSGKRRHMLALPIGLLLTAGFRSYVAFVLLFLIPASWLVTILATKSRHEFRPAYRCMLVAILVMAAIGPPAVAEMYSNSKVKRATNVTSWNGIRKKMNSGRGAIYEKGSVPGIGESSLETVKSVATGLYFFVVSINPTKMGSIRQWMALPEVLLVLFMSPKILRGFCTIMRDYRFEYLSVVLVALALTIAYSTVTTNAGPLMRWRLQVASVYITLAAVGFANPEKKQLINDQ
tara:strand:+ start:45815 stop:47107 length:1293 start_codon:yes stop_codon:yes gene_type:complete